MEESGRAGYSNRVLVLLAAMLLPTVILGTIWIAETVRDERQHLEAVALAHAEKLVSELNNRVANQIDKLAALASSPLIDSGDMNNFRLHLQRVMQDEPHWINVILAGADGRQKINVRSPGREAPVSERDAFDRVLKTGRPAISSVVPGSVSGYRSVGLRVPVRQGNEIPYVLTAVLDVAALAESFVATVPAGWRALVMDASGRIIVRTSDGSAKTGELAAESGRKAVESDRERELRIGTSREGTDHAVVYLKSALTGWTVHAGIPVASLSVIQTGNLWFAAGGALISAVIAVLLSWLLYREWRQHRERQTMEAKNAHLEAIGRLTGGVAHDVNNLLMVVQGGASGIKRHKSDPEKVESYAETLLAATDRAAQLTRQLLSYAGKERQDVTTFDLRDRAEELSSMLDQVAGSAIQTSLFIPDDIWPVHADPGALDVAILNLARNARDAMPNGGCLELVASNVALRPGRDSRTGLDGDYVAIAVTDTGTGIAEENLGRIFDPFFTTKGAEKGSGLGLSQVQGFAHQSGGTVTVDSQPGIGTTFRLYLPRSSETASKTQVRTAVPRSGGGHVLLVEDNPDVSNAAEIMLGNAGYTFVTASNAAEALALLDRAEKPVDVVLSDVVMGDGPSGIELEARIRQRSAPPPVVLMTGYSEALRDGAARGLRILSKPYTETELVDALEAARLERRQSGSPAGLS